MFAKKNNIISYFTRLQNSNEVSGSVALQSCSHSDSWQLSSAVNKFQPRDPTFHLFFEKKDFASMRSIFPICPTIS